MDWRPSSGAKPDLRTQGTFDSTGVEGLGRGQGTGEYGSALAIRPCTLPIACWLAIHTPHAPSVNLHAANVEAERSSGGDGLERGGVGCRRPVTGALLDAT
jgi:hypothetical protein